MKTQRTTLTKRERIFIDTVWSYYHQHGRHTLPWRQTTHPYKILVSEVMLQQTQVDRVIPKYRSFLKRFGTVEKLSSASLGDVLREWQGLGYNRRAKMLYECAKRVVIDYESIFPKNIAELQQLPGVGPYTASAICTFAYNVPLVMIETNIRTVFLHHFFKHKNAVTDKELARYIEKCLLVENDAREWYAALMDYGSYLKSQFDNPNKRSKHYNKQSVFKGSNRQIRGTILRLLVNTNLNKKEITKRLSQYKPQCLQTQLTLLQKEGLIQFYNSTYCLPQ
ncbi:MAG: A/G-specific adenine glycosylase [Candidatus Paceibacterota bacterium]